MGFEKLSPRLAAAAAMIPPCRKLADIGTDHAWLPIWLIQQGRAEEACACDIARGPLVSARENIRAAGLDGRIHLYLSDGFAACPRDIDCAVIAGMGGETIMGILDRAPWLKEGTTLILQPQTKIAQLRAWLAENGWCVKDARLAQDTGRLYVLFRALPGSEPLPSGAALYADPLLRKQRDPLLGVWVDQLIDRKQRALEGLLTGGQIPQAAEAQALIDELKQIREEVHSWQL